MPLAINRRAFVKSGAIMGAGCLVGTTAMGKQPLLGRVILDNDFAGDPDGLFQLAHHVLSRSVFIPLIIGSHLPAGFSNGHEAQDSADRALELLKVMGLDKVHHPVAGSETPITSRQVWRPSKATDAIIHEAMRDDTTEPLIYAAGAGLTELALAWLREPRIGKRIKLIWIGGKSPQDLGNPGAGADKPEFNFSIDPLAAQIIFNESDIEIWQVPSSTYSQMLFSMAEMEELAATGPLGAYLKGRVEAMAEMIAHIPNLRQPALSDAYVLGDSPLVTLTTLLPPLQPDTTSCRHVLMATPRMLADGNYAPRKGGRLMRVYTQIDAGLTFHDMQARIRLHAKGRI